MSKKSETIKRLNKRIKDRNYRFSKMTSAEKRVRIAKDVIAMLDEEKLVANTGTYLDPGQYAYDSCCNLPDTTQVHEILEPLEHCTVCGIGAAFVATVLRADNLTIGDMTTDLTNDIAMRKYLELYFTSKQLALIECAFELESRFCDCYDYDSDTYKPAASKADCIKAVRFGDKFNDNDNVRLRAIFNNIVENSGKFVPA